MAATLLCKKVVATALLFLLSSGEGDARTAEPSIIDVGQKPAVQGNDAGFSSAKGGAPSELFLHRRYAIDRSGGSHVVYGHKRSAFGDFMGSIMAAALGFIMFLLSFPCLWFNEQRQAKMEILFIRAAKNVRTNVNPDKVDPNCDRMLVHMMGESKTAEMLSDRQYELKVTNCAKLCRLTEMYQWVEHKEEEDKKTRYWYSKEWRAEAISSASFHDPSYTNPSPSKRLGTVDYVAHLVTLGAFALPRDMVQRLCKFRSCTDEAFGGAAGNEGAMLPGGWRRSGGYLAMGTGKSVGDIRVSFSKVPCGNCTILAVQAGSCFEPMDFKSEVKQSGKVMPLGSLQQPLNPGGQSIEGGCCGGCCKACGAVGELIESGENIYEIHERHMTAKQVIQSAQSDQQMMHCGLQLGGWFCMCFGLWMMFFPFPTLFRFIPFLGTYIQHAIGWLIALLAFFLGSFLTSVTIGIAWLAAHPAKATKFLVMGALCIASMIFVAYMMRGVHDVTSVEAAGSGGALIQWPQ